MILRHPRANMGLPVNLSPAFTTNYTLCFSYKTYECSVWFYTDLLRWGCKTWLIILKYLTKMSDGLSDRQKHFYMPNCQFANSTNGSITGKRALETIFVWAGVCLTGSDTEGPWILLEREIDRCTGGEMPLKLKRKRGKIMATKLLKIEISSQC